jgi:hypothetical protein
MELLLSLACEEARSRPDGRLDFIGVFDELNAPGFPAAQDRMTVVFVMAWAEGQEGRREFTADLVDADDRKVLTIEGHTDVTGAHGPGRPKTQLIMPLERVVFPHEGEYRFVLTVDGTRTRALSLVLSERPEEGPPPG